jgi:WD40 repeat protein
MTPEADESAPWFFPIAIGAYRDGKFENIEVDVCAELTRLEEILAQFRVTAEPWAVPMAGRGRNEVDDRLRAWCEAEDSRNSVLYWTGHGWSNRKVHALAHAFSPAHVGRGGITPEVLAEAVDQRMGSPLREETWSFIVIDTCKSSIFADNLDRVLESDRYLLLGVSGDGKTTVGKFGDALRSAVDHAFAHRDSIKLSELGDYLNRELTGSYMRARGLDDTAILEREVQPSNIALDTRAELTRILRELSPDERRHFIPKAQGPETTELLWLFEGRDSKIRRVLGWLGSPEGLLVVTGSVGSGKSALLGHLIMLSRVELRDLLVRRGLIPPVPAAYHAFAGAFEAAVLLTGATASAVVTRFARELALGDPVSGDLDLQIDWLCKQLSARTALTVIVDALDEAVEPLEIAQRVLLRIAQVPGVRLIVGTRRSTQEGPALPETRDMDILDVLMPERDGPQLHLDYEPFAVARYLGRLLRDGLPGAAAGDVQAAVDQVISDEREFLYARLAAHEILADPGYLRTDRRDDLRVLLGHDYAGLFNVAVRRLTDGAPQNRALLTALASAEGRGLPMLDQVWQAVARACAEPGLRIETPHIAELLRQAEPYLILDSEDDQSVYRLAHRALAELLGAGETPRRHVAIVRELLAAAGPGEPLNRYVAAHLCGHAARVPEAWWLIAERPDVLDRLDPASVAAHAFPAGLANVPPEIAGVAMMADVLDQAGEQDRPGWRQIGTARHGGHPGLAVAGHWSPRWAALAHRPPSHVVGRHPGPVTALAVASSDAGQLMIVSCGDAGRAVRIWDPASAPGAGGRTAGTAGVRPRALVVFQDRNRRTRIAVGAEDRTLSILDGRSFDTGQGGVRSVTAIPRADSGGADLLTGGVNGTLRRWNPETGEQIGADWVGHRNGAVLCLARLTMPGGAIWVVSGGTDGTLRLWDPETGKADWIGHTGGGVLSIDVIGLGRDARIVSGGSDGTLRVWDPRLGQQVGVWTVADSCRLVSAVTAIHGSLREAFAVSGGDDGRLRLWDLRRGRQIGASWPAGHTAPVQALAASGPTIVSAGDDGSVRMTDVYTAASQEGAGPRHTGQVLAVASAAPYVVSGGDDGIRVWDQETGEQVGDVWPAGGAVQALCHVTLADRREVVVSGGHDMTLRRWDMTKRIGAPIGDPLTGHRGRITAIAAIPGTSLVVSGSVDADLRLWDVTTGQQQGSPWTGHKRGVQAIITVQPDGRGPLVVSAGADGQLRIWDPADGSQPRDPVNVHRRRIRALTTIPEAPDQVITADDDGLIRLWSIPSGTEIGDAWQASHAIIGLAAAPNATGGTDVIFASRTGVGRWDPRESKLLAYAKLPYQVSGVAVVGEAVTVATAEGILALNL